MSVPSVRLITWKETSRSGMPNLGAIGRIRHVRKFFPQRGTAWPFRFSRPNVGNISASGEGSLQTLCHASITGRTCSGTGIGALLSLVFNAPHRTGPHRPFHAAVESRPSRISIAALSPRWRGDRKKSRRTAGTNRECPQQHRSTPVFVPVQTSGIRPRSRREYSQ